MSKPVQQGYSGSTVQRKGGFVEKTTTDQTFVDSPARQRDLVALSRSLAVLPRIERADAHVILMEYVDGHEGLTEHNAWRVGQALRLLHDNSDYRHFCATGIEWLVDLANETLERVDERQRISDSVAAAYLTDALIHSEPVQAIEKPDGAIVFIDIEGIGMGSRYHDLGFVYYIAIKQDALHIYDEVLRGYHPEPEQIEGWRVRQLAGIIALAYAGFAEQEERTRLGLRLLSETDALIPI